MVPSSKIKLESRNTGRLPTANVRGIQSEVPIPRNMVGIDNSMVRLNGAVSYLMVSLRWNENLIFYLGCKLHCKRFEQNTCYLNKNKDYNGIEKEGYESTSSLTSAPIQWVSGRSTRNGELEK